jgi:hypothetical protein
LSNISFDFAFADGSTVSGTNTGSAFDEAVARQHPASPALISLRPAHVDLAAVFDYRLAAFASYS